MTAEVKNDENFFVIVVVCLHFKKAVEGLSIGNHMRPSTIKD